MKRLVFLLLAAWGSPAAGGPAAVRVLEDFEDGQALARWKFAEVRRELTAAHAVEGSRAARLRFPPWHRGQYEWPAAILNYGQGDFTLRDWSPYEALRFAVYNEAPLPALLELRLDDRAGRRARRAFAVPARQSRTCAVSIAGLEEIDVSQVVHFNLYMTQPPAPYTLELDHIRLEADSLEVEEVRLFTDPFEGGRGEVRARLNRKGRCSVRIVDEGGAVVRQERQEGARFLWRWEGEGLAPGLYRVLWRVQDVLLQGEERTRELGAFRVVAPPERAALAAWSAPSTRKLMLDSLPPAGRGVVRWSAAGTQSGEAVLHIDMARNEFEGVQLVFLSRARSRRLRFALEALHHVESGAAFPLAQSELYQVGYVKTKDPVYYPVEHTGWWPDPLLPVEEMQAQVGECMPVWLRLHAPAAAEPGLYRGQVAVWAEGGRVGSLPLEVQVYAATLPESTTVRTAFGVSEGMLEQIYGAPVSRRVHRRFEQFIAAQRLNFTSIYRGRPPSPGRTGAAIETGRLNAFNLLYLQPGEYSSERLEQIAARLEPYVERLRRRGWLERAYVYGFDEATSEQFAEVKKVFGFLKERYPGLHTATTAKDPSFGLASGLDKVVDIWVPLSEAYDEAAAQAARARGREVWWYICIATPHPFANWFVEYPALEARLLWWMSFQRQVGGFLYYSLDYWPNQKEPLRPDGGNKTNWNPASYKTANGDGCLLYAGPEGPFGSVRLENIRDGIEDYELLHLLAEQRGDGGAGSRALCGELVRSLRDFTRDSHRFARVRRRLLEEVE